MKRVDIDVFVASLVLPPCSILGFDGKKSIETLHSLDWKQQDNGYRSQNAGSKTD